MESIGPPVFCYPAYYTFREAYFCKRFQYKPFDTVPSIRYNDMVR